MANRKSAKDLAFEKERIRFRREIHKLEAEKQVLSNQNRELAEQVKVLEKDREMQAESIQQLLELKNLSPDELELLLARVKSEAHLARLFEDVFRGLARCY